MSKQVPLESREWLALCACCQKLYSEWLVMKVVGSHLALCPTHPALGMILCYSHLFTGLAGYKKYSTCKGLEVGAFTLQSR